MTGADLQHRAVMLEPVMRYLNQVATGVYVDATFGRGGHSRAILSGLEVPGLLIAVDKDPAAALAAQALQGETFKFVAASYAQLKTVVSQCNCLGKVNGILIDCGVSSPQLDDPSRGFSFQREGPLDMRMNPTTGITAAEWIVAVEEEELAKTIKQFGEERYARRIARAIKTAQREQPIVTTTQLAEIVKHAIPKWEAHKHPATRTFQALRIVINNELKELSECLEASLACLVSGGRLLVMSFHSLEDGLVKRFIRHHVSGDDFPKEIPLTSDQLNPQLRWVVKKVGPDVQEIAINPRARSAVLRVAEKI